MAEEEATSLEVAEEEAEAIAEAAALAEAEGVAEAGILDAGRPNPLKFSTTFHCE